MKNSRKKFAILMALLLVLSVFAPVGAAYATEGPEIAVGTESGKPGQEVQVPMTIAGNPGIMVAAVELNYGEGLELVSVTVDNQCVLTMSDFDTVDYAKRPYAILLQNSAVADTAANGILATLTFRININAVAGDQQITVAGAYGNNSITNYAENGLANSFTFTSGKVTVIDKEVTGITLKTVPAKTAYLEGAPFDPTGGVITVSYDNDTYEDIPITGAMVSGYSANAAGTQTLTVTYAGKTATFPVTVTAKSLESIAVTTPPAKTAYIEGQAFDPAGMAVAATYDNGTTAPIPITECTFSPSPLAFGTESVTVAYNGKAAAQAVTVSRKSLDHLAIAAPGLYVKTYLEGQRFDRSFLTIDAYYDNGTSDTAVAYAIDNEDGPLTVGQASVTARYQGLSLAVPITVGSRANVDAMISDIDTMYDGIDSLTYEDEAAVNALSGRYEALMDIEKGAVTNKGKLDALVAKMDALLYPVYDDEKLAGGLVDVHADTGVIPHDARVTVYRKGAETAPANAIRNKFGGGSVVYAVFDISLLRDGAKIQPNGNVGVRILIDAAWDRAGLAVLRVENDGALTNMDAQIEDGYLVFETGHFSDYVVAKLAATPASNGGGSSKTGDDTPVAFLAAIVLVALALLAGSVWGYIRLNGRRRRA